MNVFLDSSALVKRYVDEDGSQELDDLLLQASSVAAAVIAPTEVVSALCRLRRESRLTARQYANARDALSTDLRDVTLVGIDEEVIIEAMNALERWPLRSADALHIACASTWSADMFVSADQSQLRAARAKGLRVEELGGN